MSFLRVKTIKKKKYLHRQTSVRKGTKVHSIIEYVCALGWIAVASASPGRPGGCGNKPADKRHMRHHEESDSELFHRDRAAFNVKQRQDYEGGSAGVQGTNGSARVCEIVGEHYTLGHNQK